MNLEQIYELGTNLYCMYGFSMLKNEMSILAGKGYLIFKCNFPINKGT